jgi:Ca2+-binding RTX toxin-like protein
MAIVGTNGADVLQSLEQDLIQGLGGADTLSSIHDDTLEGGAGNDLLQSTSPFSDYNGFASYAHSTGGVRVELNQPGPQSIGANQGVDTLVKLRGLIGSAYNDTLSAGASGGAGVFSAVYGGDGADSISGGLSDAQLYGDAGDDTIDAASAGFSAIAIGGAGNDLIYTNPNGQSVNAGLGGDGDDRIYNARYAVGGDGTDTLVGGHPQGLSTGAILQGQAGDDSLVGTDGSDGLYGGAGRNTLVGGGGGDTVHVFDLGDLISSPAYRNDVVRLTGSNNWLNLQDGPNDVRSFVDLNGGTAHIDQIGSGSPQRLADVTFDNIQRLWGTNGDDSVVGSSGDDTLQGIAGADTLFGGDGNDAIYGGGRGHNQINGNKGDDTIVGGSPVGDWLLGGQGNDSITAGAGANIVNGNLGNDTIISTSFENTRETLRGGQGDDLIISGFDSAVIFGDLGHNTLTGNLGSDTFHGGAGHDLVTDFAIGSLQNSTVDHVLIDPGVTWQATQSGANVMITFSNGGDMLLQNVQLSGLPVGWIGTT